MYQQSLPIGRPLPEKEEGKRSTRMLRACVTPRVVAAITLPLSHAVCATASRPLLSHPSPHDLLRFCWFRVRWHTSFFAAKVKDWFPPCPWPAHRAPLSGTYCMCTPKLVSRCLPVGFISSCTHAIENVPSQNGPCFTAQVATGER